MIPLAFISFEKAMFYLAALCLVVVVAAMLTVCNRSQK